MMRRRRPRARIFWAWTLTLTAALLAVVWVGSMRVGVLVHTPKGTPGLRAGRIVFVRAAPLRLKETTVRTYVRDGWRTAWWFDYVNEPAPASIGGTTLIVQIPLWPFVLLTGVPGVWMLVKTRKHTNPHACPACGYDRTGLPQTSTGPAPCPECGKGKADDAVKG